MTLKELLQNHTSSKSTNLTHNLVTASKVHTFWNNGKKPKLQSSRNKEQTAFGAQRCH